MCREGGRWEKLGTAWCGGGVELGADIAFGTGTVFGPDVVLDAGTASCKVLSRNEVVGILKVPGRCCRAKCYDGRNKFEVVVKLKIQSDQVVR